MTAQWSQLLHAHSAGQPVPSAAFLRCSMPGMRESYRWRWVLSTSSRCKTPSPPQSGAAGVGDRLAGEEEEAGAASIPAQHRRPEACVCGEE